MNTKFLFATAIICALGFSNAEAQVRKTAKHQHTRIKQGVKSGELTKAETKNLVHDQKEIRQDVRIAKSDGVVTGVEKKEIRQDQRQASRKIYRKKHNDRDRN
ncbi:MAG: hypothetical protein H7Z13_08575 [Ferruginibacter sp.]|nr:hypothetical protein [Ferruginibacter sp.]